MGMHLLITQRTYGFLIRTSSKFLKYTEKSVTHSVSYTAIHRTSIRHTDAVAFEDLREVDQFVYMKLQDLIEEVRKAYDKL